MPKRRNIPPEQADPRQALPAISRLLDYPATQALLSSYPRPYVLDALRQALDTARDAIAQGNDAPGEDALLHETAMLLQDRLRDRLRPVVNATGILLHTGLGRAVLPKAAAASLAELDRCCNLQIDLDSGLRGKRNATTEELLCTLTGAEAAVVVNNNAAATLLMLTALCKDREVVVSRGQLIEIGGSYRLPDCILQSGAVMVEVGMTNKTHLRDYEQAITDNTGALLRVNPSNYRVVGFSKSVPITELAPLGHQHGVLVMDDLGCGALVDLSAYGLPHEPTVQESIQAGADVVCFSGDKLIGGPQAGIIVGKAPLIQQIKKHPLTRMLRVGKLTDLALERTLALFLEPETLLENHPTLCMLSASVEQLRRRAEDLVKQLTGQTPGLSLRVATDSSAMGGGALPDVEIPTAVVAVSSSTLSPETISRALRHHEPPVIARIQENEVLLDMRTVMDGEEDMIIAALSAVAASQ